MPTPRDTPGDRQLAMTLPAKMRQAVGRLQRPLAVVLEVLRLVAAVALSSWRWMLVLVLLAAILRLGPLGFATWAGSALMHGLRLFQSSGLSPATRTYADTPSLAATPAISGLARGATACGAFLLDKVAALASASAAASSVATIASVALPKERDLDSIAVLPPNWEETARTTSQEVDDAIGRLYNELQLEQQELAYASHLAWDTVRLVGGLDQSARKEVLPNGLWAALWGSALGQRKKLCLRALDQLLDLVEQRGPVRAGLLAELEELRKKVEELLLPAEGGTTGTTSTQPKQAKQTKRAKPAAAYVQGIANLNCMFDSTLTGDLASCTTRDEKRQTQQDVVDQGRAEEEKVAQQQHLVRSLRDSASSEQAAFLQDLYTVHGAGNMVYGVVYNAYERLKRPVDAAKEYQRWTDDVKEQLVAIRGRLEGAETWIELGLIAKEIAREADDWRSKIQELYYV